MQVRYKNAKYEMTLSDGIKFQAIAFWFPLRRFLRALKRIARYLLSWISTLAVFLPICLVSFHLLMRFGQFERPEDANIELALILLGSVALLAIKEFRDSEVLRHQKLQQQWGSYTDCQYEFTGALHNLANIAGICFDDEYYVLSSIEVYKNAQITCGTCSPSFDKQTIYDNLSQIMRAGDSLLEESIRIGFIDWDYSDVKNFRYKVLCNDIDGIIRNSDTSLSRDDVFALGEQMVYFLATARHPWRYGNDIAHQKILKRFLEEHGERI